MRSMGVRFLMGAMGAIGSSAGWSRGQELGWGIRSRDGNPCMLVV